MTEWRIRLEGSGPSSGTPFEKRWLWSALLLRSISLPDVEKKPPEQQGTFPPLLGQIHKAFFFIYT